MVLAHTDPDGLMRLVRRVRMLSPTCDVVVRYHRADYVDPASLRAAGAFPLRSPVAVRWGDWSQVESALGSLAFARGVSDARWFVVVSGQDYPIRDLSTWEREVTAGGYDALLSPFPPQPSNYDLRWPVVPSPRTGVGLVDRSARFAINRIGERLRPLAHVHSTGRADDDRMWVGLPRRRRPPIRVTKCALWMTVNLRALDALLLRHRRDRKTRHWFQHVKFPEESYLASVLHDTPDLRIGHGDTSAQLFRPGKANPDWVDLTLLDRLRRSSTAPFARKFGVGVPAEVIEAADALARRSPTQVRAEATEPGRRTDADQWPSQVRATIVSAGPTCVR